RAFLRLEAAIEHGQVLVADAGRAFNGAGGIDVADDRVHLLRRIAQLPQRGRHGLVDDLDHAAADQLFVFDESEVRLNAGGVAVHHETDGPGRRQHRYLRVAIAVTLAQGKSFVPGLAAAFEQRSRNVLLIDFIDRRPVHADDVQERLAIAVPTRARAAGNIL